MRVYWLSLLPLAGALVVALLRSRRVPMLIAVPGALLGYLRLTSALPLEQAETFLTQSWMLDAGARELLTLAGWATAILLAIAAADAKAEGVHAPLLASLGLLSAAVLLRSWLLSALLLPGALIVPVLATLPTDRTAPRGAANFMAWATAPVPFLLGIPWLLDQLAVHPQEIAVVSRSAWLLLPAWMLWLNLFPFNGATPLWAAGDEPLGPAFQWAVKDGVILYLLLGLWRQMPDLQTAGVLSILGTLGLLTTLFSGIWAVIQSRLSGVLGCAAMAVLGLVVQGLAAGTWDSMGGAMFVLLSRGVAVLMSTAALAALHNSPAGKKQETGVRFPWEGLLLWLIAIAGVLALLRLPTMADPASGRSLLEMLLTPPGEPRLEQAWRISAIGILIGLAHTSWRLWRERVRSSAGRIRPVPLLLAVGLLLLGLYLARSPQVVARWVSGLML